MNEHVRVEIVPCTVDADESIRTGRDEAVRRLGALGHLHPESGEVSPTVTRWSARINGAEFPVEVCSVEPGVDGRAVVSLMVAADQVSVGRSPANDPQPAAEQPADTGRRVWGDPSIPDPRAGMPGFSTRARPTGAAVRDVVGRLG